MTCWVWLMLKSLCHKELAKRWQRAGKEMAKRWQSGERVGLDHSESAAGVQREDGKRMEAVITELVEDISGAVVDVSIESQKSKPERHMSEVHV